MKGASERPSTHSYIFCFGISKRPPARRYYRYHLKTTSIKLNHWNLTHLGLLIPKLMRKISWWHEIRLSSMKRRKRIGECSISPLSTEKVAEPERDALRYEALHWLCQQAARFSAVIPCPFMLLYRAGVKTESGKDVASAKAFLRAGM